MTSQRFTRRKHRRMTNGPIDQESPRRSLELVAITHRVPFSKGNTTLRFLNRTRGFFSAIHRCRALPNTTRGRLTTILFRGIGATTSNKVTSTRLLHNNARQTNPSSYRGSTRIVPIRNPPPGGGRQQEYDGNDPLTALYTARLLRQHLLNGRTEKLRVGVNFMNIKDVKQTVVPLLIRTNRHIDT